MEYSNFGMEAECSTTKNDKKNHFQKNKTELGIEFLLELFN